MPRVSIITAAYNHARFIRQAIESAQGQTYRDFEHVVVDDGSSDGTAEVLRSFGDRISYIRQDNCGAHAALNRAIRESSGELIALLDSDDAWLPNKLERQVEAFERHPGAGLVYSQASLIDDTGRISNNSAPIGKPLTDPLHSLSDLLNENHIPTLTAIFKRECIDEVGYFDESFKAMADWDLWLRISARWPIIFVPEPLALYRVHDNNAGKSLFESGRVFRERLLLLRNAEKNASGNSREVIRAKLSQTALRTTYGFCYRRQFAKARAYFLFALQLHPLLLRDALVSLRPRYIARLLAGERAINALKSRGSLENGRL